jgi:hypothetical protein
MLGARWIFGIACLAACATGGPTRVRDIDGRPLPPHAVSDATGPVRTVECKDGNTYLVVMNRPPLFRSTKLDAALREREKSIDDVCDRILANGR